MDTSIEDDVTSALYAVRGVRDILSGNLMHLRDCAEVCHVMSAALNEAERDLADALERLNKASEQKRSA